MKKGSVGRQRRRMRIRKKVCGMAERPRLSVFRSNKHTYAQLIDDLAGRTLVAANTLSAQVRDKLKDAKGRKDAARLVGSVIAELAKAKGIKRIVFDRAGYRYHGRIRALAEGAREEGLKF